jgi:hypothetical protein
MSYREIVHDRYKVIFEEPEIYVNNEARKRSGHMTHAMAQFAPDTFIDFNANCSAARYGGHSAYGWVEYRISHDAGKTYTAPQTFPYSMESFLDGNWTVSVEKAVACDDGTIVALCLRNTMLTEVCCEPWLTPVCIRSTDGGKTWTEPYECIPYKGRIYDAVYKDGVIYAMIFCNEHFLGSTPEHVYRLYVSEDSGRSFSERCVVPFPDTKDRSYCCMQFDQEGMLHAYAYNMSAENEMDHAVSADGGRTWTVTEPCFVEKGIRNPQTAYIDGVYVLHGRGGGHRGFVFYSSADAVHWDEGIYLGDCSGGCYYSNNVNLKDEKGDFLLVQYSDVYGGYGMVNAMHMRLRIER